MCASKTPPPDVADIWRRYTTENPLPASTADMQHYLRCYLRHIELDLKQEWEYLAEAAIHAVLEVYVHGEDSEDLKAATLSAVMREKRDQMKQKDLEASFSPEQLLVFKVCKWCMWCAGAPSCTVDLAVGRTILHGAGVHQRGSHWWCIRSNTSVGYHPAITTSYRDEFSGDVYGRD